MLDSLIYLLEKDRFDLSYRRTFNQSRVLQECILQELRVIAPEVAQTILMHNSKKKKSISSSREDFTPVPSSSVTLYSLLAHFSQKELFEQFLAFPLLSVDSIDPHWADVSVLKKQLSDEPTAKSRKKFLAIVEALTAHPLLHYFRFDFKKILTIVVFKALFIFAVPSTSCGTVYSSSRASKETRPPRDVPAVSPVGLSIGLSSLYTKPEPSSQHEDCEDSKSFLADYAPPAQSSSSSSHFSFHQPGPARSSLLDDLHGKKRPLDDPFDFERLSADKRLKPLLGEKDFSFPSAMPTMPTLPKHPSFLGSQLSSADKSSSLGSANLPWQPSYSVPLPPAPAAPPLLPSLQSLSAPAAANPLLLQLLLSLSAGQAQSPQFQTMGLGNALALSSLSLAPQLAANPWLSLLQGTSPLTGGMGALPGKDLLQTHPQLLLDALRLSQELQVQQQLQQQQQLLQLQQWMQLQQAQQQQQHQQSQPLQSLTLSLLSQHSQQPPPLDLPARETPALTPSPVDDSSSQQPPVELTLQHPTSPPLSSASASPSSFASAPADTRSP